MNIPYVKFLSQQLETIGVLANYTSLRFNQLWQGVGDFEIHTSEFDSECFKIGNIVMLDSAYKTGIITGVKSSLNGNKRDITITGTTLNGLASRRIVLPFSDDNLNHLNGGYFCCPYKTSADSTITPVPAETILKSFARQGFKAGGDSRQFPNLALVVDSGRGMESVWMSRYEQLDDVLQSIAEYCDMGWRIYPVFVDEPYLVFNVNPGVDRSCSQSENSRVIISPEFGSASEITYTTSDEGYKNVAYAGGVGEDADRVVLAVTNEDTMPTGYDRYEVFADCGTLEVAETDESLSLADEGKHKLTEYTKVNSLTATLTTTGSFRYGVDYDIGDLVTVVDRAIGVNQDMRLTGVEECYEASTIQVRGVLGESPAHLGRTIRSMLPTKR